MKLPVVATSLTVALLTCCWCSALPPNKEHKDRTIDHKLSQKEHDHDGEHSNDYDHDAFLGEEDAKEFDDLSPEESKRRLGLIVDKIDKDKDGFVKEEELVHWIQYVQKKYVMDDTERQWKDHEADMESKPRKTITWDSYRKRVFGFEHDDQDENFLKMVQRDKRKFEAADEDHDGEMTIEEFANFLHPEEASHMQEIVIQETIEDIDKNGDGMISLEEYIADIYDEEDDEDDDEEENGDHDGYPDWVNSEKEQFKNFRDRNHDGFLDRDEVKEWLIPEEYDNSLEESKHLMSVTDDDRDGKLTKEEILDKYDVFVGSQATDFGEALTRHDEF